MLSDRRYGIRIGGRILSQLKGAPIRAAILRQALLDSRATLALMYLDPGGDWEVDRYGTARLYADLLDESLADLVPLSNPELKRLVRLMRSVELRVLAELHRRLADEPEEGGR